MRSGGGATGRVLETNQLTVAGVATLQAGWTPVQIAACMGHQGAVRALIELRADALSPDTVR